MAVVRAAQQSLSFWAVLKPILSVQSNPARGRASGGRAGDGPQRVSSGNSLCSQVGLLQTADTGEILLLSRQHLAHFCCFGSSASCRTVARPGDKPATQVSVCEHDEMLFSFPPCLPPSPPTYPPTFSNLPLLSRLPARKHLLEMGSRATFFSLPARLSLGSKGTSCLGFARPPAACGQQLSGSLC